MPIICCHPATINPSDLIPPYFTIIVPIAQLKPADKVIKKPKIFSKTELMSPKSTRAHLKQRDSKTREKGDKSLVE